MVLVRRGFTFVEMLVVTGIILVLMSLLMPALQRARQAAKETASKGNLRQVYIGLMLYSERYDAKVEYGRTSDMGLPIGMSSTPAYLEVVGSKQVWKSPCCCHKDAGGGFPTYAKYFTDYVDFFYNEEQWQPYVTKWESNAILVVDYHCNDADNYLYGPAEPVKGIGVRLNGKIETRRRTRSIAWSIAGLSPFWNP